MIARSDRYVEKMRDLHERVNLEVHRRVRMRMWLILSWVITGTVIASVLLWLAV